MRIWTVGLGSGVAEWSVNASKLAWVTHLKAVKNCSVTESPTNATLLLRSKENRLATECTPFPCCAIPSKCNFAHRSGGTAPSKADVHARKKRGSSPNSPDHSRAGTPCIPRHAAGVSTSAVPVLVGSSIGAELTPRGCGSRLKPGARRVRDT